jgi:hypothetical protein
MITPHAKLSLQLTHLCEKIEKGYDLGKLYTLWSAKSECYKIMDDLIKADLSPESCLAVGMAKVYRECPQDVSDMLETVLGWRLYRNIHDRNIIGWGRPPKSLGGEGEFWTWKASELDFGPAIKIMIHG